MNEEEYLKKYFLTYFLLSLFTFLILDIALSYFSYKVYMANEKFRWESETSHELNASELLLSDKIHSIISDLLYLANTESLKNFNESSIERNYLENDFYKFSLAKEIYNQVRFIGVNGDEIIRIDYENGIAKKTKIEDLQNKRHRYYFRESINLKEGDVYISELDLNIENGKIEVPYKPMLRLGATVYNENMEKKGVVILNCFGNYILNKIRVHELEKNNFAYKVAVINNEGYYLKAFEKNKEWGFMFPERYDETISKDMNEEWNILKEKDKGVFYSKNGFFNYYTYYPLREALDEGKKLNKNFEGNIIKQKDYYWKIIFSISNEYMENVKEQGLKRINFFNLLIIPILCLVSIIMAYYASNNKLYKLKLEYNANYDILTGIYNRRFGIEILRKFIDISKRRNSPLTIAYFDINNLKLVNDNFGHTEGDFYIKTVVEAVKKVIRSSDIFFRLGGDEFMLIFNDCRKEQADDVISKIKEKLSLARVENKKTYTISASFGVLEYNKNEFQSEKEFIAKADELMYNEKVIYHTKNRESR